MLSREVSDNLSVSDLEASGTLAPGCSNEEKKNEQKM
jgi:hypothetical protein